MTASSLLVELSAVGWALLALAAFSVGLSKTAIPGIGTIAVVVFAAVLPAKQSTSTLLLLLIVGDAFALWAYRRHANWSALVKLIPAVVVGGASGAVFLAMAENGGVRRVIGVILLALVAITVCRRYLVRIQPAVRGTRIARTCYGALGGFTTMVANAGGPVMSLYFLAAQFPVKEFLGTAA